MKLAALALAALLALPGAVQAQQLLESYTAYLSAHDHYNSRGVRLTAYWQVIRQDRANFHRFGTGDPQDEWDRFFGSMQNRAVMEQMILNGTVEPGVASYIVNNEVMVQVDVYGYGNQISYVNVTAY
ncbi:hypothetical protein P1J78_04005 [Psychromarinibacter sp. C21-152]|uniref:Nuclear transport factor 2 family protein n=1 Tax=Psychromarinibacter sediminicola TaxID=3033385 RepID=A0AAE3T8V1_9RHOB|nr:hypothetical protein [Psychromarinibacter sediminicola]MDF0599890.1 hypothetical protein [Psychromarinibacter sediminicola]